MASFGAKEQKLKEKRSITTSVIHVVYKSREAQTASQKVAQSAIALATPG